MNPLKIIKYGKYFSESRFLAFATRYGKKLAFVQKAVVLFFCLRDQDTPKYVKNKRKSYSLLATNKYIKRQFNHCYWLDCLCLFDTLC